MAPERTSGALRAAGASAYGALLGRRRRRAVPARGGPARKPSCTLHRVSRMCVAASASLAKSCEQAGHRAGRPEARSSRRSAVRAPCAHRWCEASAAAELQMRARPGGQSEQTKQAGPAALTAASMYTGGPGPEARAIMVT